VNSVPAPDAQALTAIAAATAREVGQHLLQWRHAQVSVASDTKSSPTDVVTTADHEAESMIRRRLLAAYPDAGWWGEESGRAAGSGAELEWVVDPIDGTVNFLYDLPGWAVSIAAVWQGEVIGAAVMVPTTGTLFSASQQMGAWLDDEAGRRPLHPSRCHDLTQALVATGFAYDAAVRTEQGAAVGRLVGQVRDIRRAGAAAVDLCSVAAGRVDAFFERSLQPWDRAAGGFIAREAGAVVTERDDGSVAASGPALAGSFEELLVEVGAWP
jgi:myo-inositol-1(or 4)-monophosphatase